MNLNDARFLTIILAVTSVIVFSVSCLGIPVLYLEGDNDTDDIRCARFIDTLNDMGGVFPAPTKSSIGFANSKVLRIILCLLIIALALTMEIAVKSRKIAGAYHILVFIAGTLMGFWLLMSAVLPFMPL